MGQGLGSGRVNSWSTDTGLGCSLSNPEQLLPFLPNSLSPDDHSSLPQVVRTLSSPSRPFTSGDDRRFSADRTASMIFLSAFKSSSHFSNAPRSFCLFSAVDSGDAGAAGITFSPINRATKAGGVRKFVGELAEFDLRISAGSVGLLWTSHENRRTEPAASTSAVLADVWDFVGDEASFLSCFRPGIGINIAIARFNC